MEKQFEVFELGNEAIIVFNEDAPYAISSVVFKPADVRPQIATVQFTEVSDAVQNN